MKAIYRQMKNHGERGSAVTEFCIITPLIALLLYTAVYLNDRLDQVVHLHISTRSATATNDPIDATRRLSELIAKDQQLAFLDANAQSQFAGQPTANTGSSTNYQSNNTNTRSNSGNTSILATSTGLRTHSWTAATADRIAAKGLNLDHETIFKTTNTVMGTVAKAGRYADTFIGTVLIPQGMQRISNSLATGSEASVYRRSINELLGTSIPFQDGSNATNTNTQARANTGSSPIDLATFDRADLYLRTEAGYHPHSYNKEAIFGYFLGRRSVWSTKFLEKCMFRFLASDHCRPNNGMAWMVVVLAEIKGISSLASFGAADALTVAAKAAVDGLGDQFTQPIIDEFTNRLDAVVKGAVQDKLEEIIEGADLVPANLQLENLTTQAAGPLVEKVEVLK